MLYTLADARAAVARFVESGTCNTTVIDARINEALSRIMDMEDWKSQRKLMRIYVKSYGFCLPNSVEKIMWADVDGTPTRVFDQPYQFLSSGPGDLDYNCVTSWYKRIIDQGDGWSTMYDIPECYEEGNECVPYEGLPIYAFSTATADTNKSVSVRGTNAVGEEIRQDIPIQRWLLGVEGRMSGHFTGTMLPSDTAFKSVERVTKAATSGHVSLYAIDVTNQYFYFLAKYAPGVTLPEFRRYKLTNANTETCTNLLALVRLRYTPLTDADDIIPIDSMQALKLMVMALREENAGNLQGAANFEAKARMALESRQQANTMSAGTQIILDFDYSMSLGEAMNNRGIL